MFSKNENRSTLKKKKLTRRKMVLFHVHLKALEESRGSRKTATQDCGSVFKLVALSELRLQLWYVVKGIMGCTATVWERAACRHVVRVDGLLWPLELWDCSCGCPGSEGELGGPARVPPARTVPPAPCYSLFGSHRWWQGKNRRTQGNTIKMVSLDIDAMSLV